MKNQGNQQNRTQKLLGRKTKVKTNDGNPLKRNAIGWANNNFKRNILE